MPADFFPADVSYGHQLSEIEEKGRRGRKGEGKGGERGILR